MNEAITVVTALLAECNTRIAAEQDADMLMLLRGESMGLRDAIHEIKMAQIRAGTVH
jgi:hypothetical protein